MALHLGTSAKLGGAGGTNELTMPAGAVLLVVSGGTTRDESGGQTLPTTITWNGVNLIKAAERTSTRTTAYVWYLRYPDAGTHDLVVNGHFKYHWASWYRGISAGDLIIDAATDASDGNDVVCAEPDIEGGALVVYGAGYCGDSANWSEVGDGTVVDSDSDRDDAASAGYAFEICANDAAGTERACFGRPTFDNFLCIAGVSFRPGSAGSGSAQPIWWI